MLPKSLPPFSSVKKTTVVWCTVHVNIDMQAYYLAMWSNHVIRYIYLHTSCKCNGGYVLNCICLCLKCEHVAERTFQSITQIIWVFIIIIYHHLCHHPKRSWAPFHHRFYTCLYSSAFVHFNLFSRHWHWQFTNTLTSRPTRDEI